ncbi:hypothetical protein vseg_009115 [Gypsophila vaccaria]
MPVVMTPVSLSGLSSPCNKTVLGSLGKPELSQTPNRAWLKRISIQRNKQILGAVHIAFCKARNISEDLTCTQTSDKSPKGKFDDTEWLELINKPTKPDQDEAFEPFLKFLKSDGIEEDEAEVNSDSIAHETDSKKIGVEYYEPKLGDFVVGVVVSGNENKLDVNVGADTLGTMLTKEVLPLYDKEMDYLLCDLDKNAEEFMANGKMGVIQDDDSVSRKPAFGKPIVDIETVIFAEVLGRTHSGRPLLSSRRYFRQIALHRVRQIEHLGEPFQVRITEWNTGGLLARLEGLRAFIPKPELVEKVNSFADLKNKVGSMMYVMIDRIDEANNDLILSERDAWEKLYLRGGALLEGTIRKIFPYGAQVRLGQTNRSGLLHASNISFGKFNSVSDILAIGEKVKVLVIKSSFRDQISLSIAALESEPGLFILDKKKVFEEAEEMARRYRRKHPSISLTSTPEPSQSTARLFDNEDTLFANWKWFEFQRENEP